MKQETSYIKTLFNKTIVEQKQNVEAMKKQYLYTAAVLQRECMAIVDSGTTCHFLQIQSKCLDKQIINEGMQVRLLDIKEDLTTDKFRCHFDLN